MPNSDEFCGEFALEKQLVTNWLRQFIVGYNLCPFAKKPLVNDQIRLAICNDKKRRTITLKLLEEMRFLDTNRETETTLVIFPDAMKDFYTYLDLVDACNQLVIAEGYEGIYQLASFHPDYFFEGEEPDDASHFTNRSPYPMIHIIREDSLERVLEQYQNPEEIPQNNIKKMRELGSALLRKKLQNL